MRLTGAKTKITMSCYCNLKMSLTLTNKIVDEAFNCWSYGDGEGVLSDEAE